MGVATGCGFKEIYRFPHTTYPYSSCICTFLQQHPYIYTQPIKHKINHCSIDKQTNLLLLLEDFNVLMLTACKFVDL